MAIPADIAKIRSTQEASLVKLGALNTALSKVVDVLETVNRNLEKLIGSLTDSGVETGPDEPGR